LGRRHRLHDVVVEEAGASLRAAWAADLKGTIRMRAREMELTRAACESERTWQSSHGCPDGRRRPGASIAACIFALMDLGIESVGHSNIVSS
jgi:hypothetical protein